MKVTDIIDYKEKKKKEADIATKAKKIDANMDLLAQAMSDAGKWPRDALRHSVPESKPGVFLTIFIESTRDVESLGPFRSVEEAKQAALTNALDGILGFDGFDSKEDQEEAIEIAEDELSHWGQVPMRLPKGRKLNGLVATVEEGIYVITKDFVPSESNIWTFVPTRMSPPYEGLVELQQEIADIKFEIRNVPDGASKKLLWAKLKKLLKTLETQFPDQLTQYSFRDDLE